MRLAWIVVLSGFVGALYAGGCWAGEPRVEGDPDFRTHGVAYFKRVIRSIVEFQGRAWVGTYGGGVHAIGPAGVETFTRENSPLLENRVNVLAVRRGELWLGTCAGFSIFDGKSWRAQTSRDGIASDIYHSCFVDERDRVWVGTAGHGVSILEQGRWRTLTPAQGVTDGWINGLAQDDLGRVWIAGGTRVMRQEGGLFALERPPWTRTPAGVTAVANRDGEIWVASALSGLAMYQAGTWYRPPVEGHLPTCQVNALTVDGAGRLWIGTAKGIVSYHPREGWARYGTEQGLVDRNIRVIHYSPVSRRLWAGSFLEGWVYLFDQARNRFDAVLHAGTPVGKGTLVQGRRE